MHDAAKVLAIALCCCQAGLEMAHCQSTPNLPDALVTEYATPSECPCALASLTTCHVIPPSMWPASMSGSALTELDMETYTG